MRGSGNVVLTLLVLAVLFMGAYLMFNVPRTQIIQQAAPVTQPGEETRTVPIWDILVTVVDDEQRPVTSATVYLLYEAPEDIYDAPGANGDYYDFADMNGEVTVRFEDVITGKQYYVLAVADGYYNAGTAVSVPKEVGKDATAADEPVLVEVSMAKKGALSGVMVNPNYQGNGGNVRLKAVGNSTEEFEAEFQFVSDGEGEIRYDRIRIDMNTSVHDVIDKLTVKVGESTSEVFESVSGAKVIDFEEEQKIAEGGSLKVVLQVEDLDVNSASGTLFTVELYDVQSGALTPVANVEAPATATN